MAAPAFASLSAADFGVVIVCTLTFTDYDPSGAVADLLIDSDPPRPMTLLGNVATYTTVPGDFKVGAHVGKVRMSKDGAYSISTEPFTFVVT